jgi:hypothetical protein
MKPSRWTFRPQSRLGWWAFSLGVAIPAWSLLSGIVGPLSWRIAGLTASPDPILFPLSVVLQWVNLVLPLPALVLGILALAKGERSWIALAPFVPVFFRLAAVVLFLASLLILGPMD